MARRNLLTGLRGEGIAQRSLIAAFIVYTGRGWASRGIFSSTPLTGHQALRADEAHEWHVKQAW